MRLRGAAAVAAIATFAVSGGTAYARERVTLTGTYQLVAKQLDNGATKLHGHAYQDVLVAGQRTYRLRFGDKPRPVGGSTVRISATSVLAGEYDIASIETLATPAATSGGTTSTLAILAYWTAPDAVTPQRARDQLFGDDNTWMREVSYGQTSLVGAATPWVKIAAPTSGRCFDYGLQIRDRARAGALTLGYDYRSYHRTLVYFPKCTGSDTTGMAGWAYEPGDSIWLNGVMDRRTSVHEHGHSFGLGHARSYDCTSNGVAVTFGGSCTTLEYGDPYDAMGQSAYAGHYTGMHKDRLGWLGTRKRVVTTPSASFTLPPFEQVSATPVVAVLNSPVAGRRYWLEYRQPLGADAKFPAGGTAGVQIHLEQNGLGPFLLDPTPSDNSFTTAVLGAGRSWTAPDGVRIAVGTISSTGASVSVSGVDPATVPPSEPRDVRAVAGDMRATVTWSPPSSSGHGTISSYEVSASNGQMHIVSPYMALSTTFTGLGNGQTHTFTVRAVNEAGRGPGASATATPAESPPTIAISSPADGAAVSGGNVTVWALAAPGPTSGVSLQNLDWYVDGAYKARTTSAAPYFTWNTDPYADGPHTVRVIVYDGNGRQAESSATYTLQNQRPTVSITSPANYATVTGGNVTLAATAQAAAGSAIDRVEFTDQAGATLGVARSAPYEVAWDVTRIDRDVLITARAYDTAGRSNNSDVVRVTVTHPPPTVAFTSPAAGATVSGTSLTVATTAAAGTPGQTVEQVVYSANGVAYPVSQAPYEARIDTSGVTGWLNVEAKVFESSGRTARVTRSFYIGNVLPDLRVTSPTNGATLSTVDTVGFAGTATPPTAGGAPVARVELSAPWTTRTVSVVPNPDGTWAAEWDVGDHYGYQTVEVRAYDAAGMWSRRTVSFSVSRPAPTVTLVSPAAGTTLSLSEPFDLVASVVMPPGSGRSVAAVSFVRSGYDYIGPGTLQPDGTYVLRDAYLTGGGSIPISVVVRESDNVQGEYARTVFDVVVYPEAPHSVTAEAHPEDGTVTVTWAAPEVSTYTPVDGYVVRDAASEVVGRTTGTTLRVRSTDPGYAQSFRVSATNRAGEGPAGFSNDVVPGIATKLLLATITKTSAVSPERISVKGRLTRLDGTPVRGAYLMLSARPLPAADWYTGATSALPTDANGYATVSFQPQFHAMVSLSYDGAGGYVDSASTSVGVSVRAGVSGNLTRGLMPLGATSTMNGTVSPAVNGKFVYLQRFYAGMWRNVTYRKMDAYGRVSIPIKPTVRGKYLYRLYYGGDARVSSNASAQRTLTVY